jgi:outer membrane protein
MKKAGVFAAVLVLSIPLWAQEVTKVAICNLGAVLATSYKETQAMRDLYAFTDAYQREVQDVRKEINALESQKLDADKAGNKTQSLQLESQIEQKKTYLNDYVRIKTEQYNNMAASVQDNSAFAKDILDAVRYVAEKEGYAIVLRSDGPGKDLLLANIPEVDITQLVIKRIYERAGKTYTEGN